MVEPISDSGLVKLRSISQGGTRGEMHASVPIDVLASILARLDRAEAKLERIRKAIPRNQYLSLPMLVEVKEIVDG